MCIRDRYLALLAERGTPSAKIFAKYHITKDKFLEALAKVRGNQRVTSQNPEENYDALNKYGRDLVEMARDGKLDPVIGRDSEIRHAIQIPVSYTHRKDRREGFARGNSIFTNTLGPMLVTNPWLTEAIVETAARTAGLEVSGEALDTSLEKKSFDAKKTFIAGKETRLTNCKA